MLLLFSLLWLTFSFYLKNLHFPTPLLPIRTWKHTGWSTQNYPNNWLNKGLQCVKQPLSSSSSCRTSSMGMPDPVPPPFSIIHCFCRVSRATSRISADLLYVGSCWFSCLCSFMWRSRQECITYEFKKYYVKNCLNTFIANSSPFNSAKV